MGFMGMADGGRIKVTLNCRGSATFMWGGAGGEKQCKYARESVSSCERSVFSFRNSRKAHFNKRSIAAALESVVEVVHSHQITLISILHEVYWWSYQ